METVGRNSIQRDRADQYVVELRDAASELSNGQFTLPARIVGAVWTGAFFGTRGMFRRYFLWLTFIALFFIPTILWPEVDYLAVSIKWAWPHVSHLPDGPTVDLIVVFFYIFVVWEFQIVLRTRAALTLRRSAAFRTAGVRHNRIPLLCAAIVIRGANLRRAQQRDRKIRHKDLEITVKELERELLKMHRDRSIFLRGSRRRKQVRQHARIVAAALQNQLLQIDSVPDVATVELCGIAMRISDSYTRQRWASLLAEGELRGLEPVQDREPVRLAVAATVTVSAAVAGALLGIPDSSLPFVVGLVGLIAFTRLLGGPSPKALELLDSVRGIQRP